MDIDATTSSEFWSRRSIDVHNVRENPRTWTLTHTINDPDLAQQF